MAGAQGWPLHGRRNQPFRRAPQETVLVRTVHGREEIVHAETIASLKEFNSNRQQRLNGVITKIPAVLWYAVLVGAGINILLLLMLKMKPLPHFVLGAINAFFLGVVLFVIVALDDPLRGDSGLPPEPFERLWEREMRWDEPRA